MSCYSDIFSVFTYTPALDILTMAEQKTTTEEEEYEDVDVDPFAFPPGYTVPLSMMYSGWDSRLPLKTEEAFPLESICKKNKQYRKLVWEAENGMQIACQHLAPKERVRRETHIDSDQYINVVEGELILTVYKVPTVGEESVISDGRAFVIKRGTSHMLEATPRGCNFITVYTRKQHALSAQTKRDADNEKESIPYMFMIMHINSKGKKDMNHYPSPTPETEYGTDALQYFHVHYAPFTHAAVEEDIHIEHCGCLKHAISSGHATGRDSKGDPKLFTFCDGCPEKDGWFHIESGVKKWWKDL